MRSLFVLVTAATACGNETSGDRDAMTTIEPLEAVEIVDTCALTIPATTSCPAGLACMTGVPYLTVGDTTLLADVVRPATGGPFPFVLLLHGGGFVGGSRADRLVDALVLAQHGFAAATIDYRLMTTTNGTVDAFPAALEDVRCAVRYARANAATLQIAPQRIGVLGTSAGAVLAGQLATESEVTGLDGGCPTLLDQPVEVNAVVAYFGAFDVRPDAPIGQNASLNATAETYLHRPPDDPAVDDLASSIVHVDRSDSALLMVHGTDDAALPIEQSRRMRDALWQIGVPATLLPIDGAGHGFQPFQTVQPFRTGACTTLAFFSQRL